METLLSKIKEMAPDELLDYVMKNLQYIPEPQHTEVKAVLNSPLDYHNLQKIIDILSDPDNPEEISLKDYDANF